MNMSFKRKLLLIFNKTINMNINHNANLNSAKRKLGSLESNLVDSVH